VCFLCFTMLHLVNLKLSQSKEKRGRVHWLLLMSVEEDKNHIVPLSYGREILFLGLSNAIR
jgi:hypothetical protein